MFKSGAHHFWSLECVTSRICRLLNRALCLKKYCGMLWQHEQ